MTNRDDQIEDYKECDCYGCTTMRHACIYEKILEEFGDDND